MRYTIIATDFRAFRSRYESETFEVASGHGRDISSIVPIKKQDTEVGGPDIERGQRVHNALVQVQDRRL